MDLFDTTAIWLAKFIRLGIAFFHLGAGGTWPGEILLRLRPHILSTFQSLQPQIILVVGTNGKTTTVKMIETILSGNSFRVRRNATGANLDNGVVSTFLEDMTASGVFRSKYFIFEVDEASLPKVLRSLRPQVLVLLNLFRDQLDRYGEVDTIAAMWAKSLRSLPENVTVLANADDPHITFMTQKLQAKVKYFGIDNPELFLPSRQHATDTIYCPNCGTKLTFGGIYFSHLGKWACGQCGLTHPKVSLSSIEVQSPIEGVYNIYNSLAATMVGLEAQIIKGNIERTLAMFVPAFGRLESLTVKGKRIRILLSKNPTGFNESLRTALASKDVGPLLVILNDRVPDGTDVSWIWDVDFEVLKGHEFAIFVSGDRYLDLANRLKYAGIDSKYLRSTSEALEAFTAAIGEKQVGWIFPTYSAMLDVRQVLLGKKIL